MEVNVQTSEISPNEIIREFYPDYDSHGWSSYSSVRNKLVTYGDISCVIAYLKNVLGSIFIIKSDRTYWAFSIRSKIINSHYYSISEIDITTAYGFFDQYPDCITLLNKDEYDKMKKSVLARKLSQ